jgi:hypothetical protein
VSTTAQPPQDFHNFAGGLGSSDSLDLDCGDLLCSGPLSDAQGFPSGNSTPRSGRTLVRGEPLEQSWPEPEPGFIYHVAIFRPAEKGCRGDPVLRRWISPDDATEGVVDVGFFGGLTATLPRGLYVYEIWKVPSDHVLTSSVLEDSGARVVYQEWINISHSAIVDPRATAPTDQPLGDMPGVTLYRGEILKISIVPRDIHGDIIVLDETWTVASSIARATNLSEETDMGAVITPAGIVYIEFDTYYLVAGTHYADVRISGAPGDEMWTERILVFIIEPITKPTPRT